MMPLIVFDLDGTLSNLDHRTHFISEAPRDWDAFYDACDKDTLIQPIATIYKTLFDSGSHTIAIWSGRRESERNKTKEWFRRHGLRTPADDHFLMRPENDYSLDTQLKQKWLKESKLTPTLIFEDRTSVVEMYRNHGIHVCQVAKGDF